MENDQRIIPATHLPEGWEWRIYDDGSGSLYSPENKRVVGVDFQTSEFSHEGELNFMAGYPYHTVSPAEFMDRMEKRIYSSLEQDKPSVLDKIREAAKEPAKPHKNKSQRNKSQPEL